jgi:hypothetical protein
MPKSSQIYLDSVMTYQPSNFSSFFEKEEHYAMDVTDSVLGFSLVTEDDLSEGELAVVRFVLKNNSNEELKNLMLKLDAPESFKITEGDFNDFENNESGLFRVGDLSSGEEKVLEIKGSVEGDVGSVKNFECLAGIEEEKNKLSLLTSDSAAIKIIPPRVELNQIAKDKDDNVANPGEVINYEITFRNNSDKPLSDLILRQDVEGDIVNRSAIQSGRGYYDDKEKQIIWRASDVPELKHLNPGEIGKVEVGIPVRTDYEIWSEEDKNITFKTRARINSLNVGSDLRENKTIYSNETEFKVATQFDVDVNIVHESEKFDNQGVFPVNNQEETEFTVNLNVSNSYNNVRDAKIYLTLPSGVVWKDNYEATGGKVDFNSRTNELEWTFDSVSYATGHLEPEERLAFQIGFTLSVANRESESDRVDLINNINYECLDSFTGKKIEGRVNPYNFKSVER